MIKRLFYRLFGWLPFVRDMQFDEQVDEMLRSLKREATLEPVGQVGPPIEDGPEGLPYIVFKQ